MIVSYSRSVMENNFCPFCAEETDEDLSEHGKDCTEYQENVATNNCPFCCTQIDQCCVVQHFKHREMMEEKMKGKKTS